MNGNSPNWKARHRNQVKRHRKQAKKYYQQYRRPLELRLIGEKKQVSVRQRILERVMSIHAYEEIPLYWIKPHETYETAQILVRGMEALHELEEEEREQVLARMRYDRGLQVKGKIGHIHRAIADYVPQYPASHRISFRDLRHAKAA